MHGRCFCICCKFNCYPKPRKRTRFSSPKNLHFAYSRVLSRLTISMLYGPISFAQNSMQNEQMHFRCCTPVRTLNLSPCRLARMVTPESQWNRKDPWKFVCDQPDSMHLLFLWVLISFLWFCTVLIHLYHCFCTEFLRSLTVYYSAQNQTGFMLEIVIQEMQL